MSRLKKKDRPRDALAIQDQDNVDPLLRLFNAVNKCRSGQYADSRTVKLVNAGIPKMAQKIIEEAGEVAIEAVRGQRAAIVNETADLLYNLVVLLNAANVPLADIWTEMARREALFGIAEKLPKPNGESLRPGLHRAS